MIFLLLMLDKKSIGDSAIFSASLIVPPRRSIEGGVSESNVAS